MSLGVGRRLGPYDITGLLGSGGMGEVYRARDTKLDRDVAIEILSELFGMPVAPALALAWPPPERRARRRRLDDD